MFFQFECEASTRRHCKFSCQTIPGHRSSFQLITPNDLLLQFLLCMNYKYIILRIITFYRLSLQLPYRTEVSAPVKTILGAEEKG